MKRKVSIISIVLYVIAGLFALYTIWTIMNVHTYLAQQSVTFKGNEFTVINYYMANAGQYGIYAIIIATLGWILQKMSPVIEKAPECAAVADLSNEAPLTADESILMEEDAAENDVEEADAEKTDFDTQE